MIQRNAALPNQPDIVDTLLDALPVPVLLVDARMQVLEANTTARHEFGTDAESARRNDLGVVIECLHATQQDNPCDHSVCARDCVVRNAIGGAIHGRKTLRCKATMQLHFGSDIREATLLVTAAPFKSQQSPLGLLTLEDVSELTQLHSILPVCASCGQVRSDEGYWARVKAYMSGRIDALGPCGYCSACDEQLHSRDTTR